MFSKEEIILIFASLKNRKHYYLIALTYATGLRVNEMVNLKLADLDSNRMQIRVRSGKVNKDRYTLLPSGLLEKLREYYQYYRPKEFLFEGQQKGVPYSVKSAQTVLKKSAEKYRNHQTGLIPHPPPFLCHPPAGAGN